MTERLKKIESLVEDIHDLKDQLDGNEDQDSRLDILSKIEAKYHELDVAIFGETV